MKTLKEHNASSLRRQTEAMKPRKTGIACPHCNGELINPAPNVVLASNPPQMIVECEQCNYRGSAYI